MKADSRFLFPLQGLFEQAFRNFTITPLTDWKRSTVYRLGAPTSPCWTSGCPVWTASS